MLDVEERNRLLMAFLFCRDKRVSRSRLYWLLGHLCTHPHVLEYALTSRTRLSSPSVLKYYLTSLNNMQIDSEESPKDVPMEKVALEALDWQVKPGDCVSPTSLKAEGSVELHIRRRFQFSSALKRMSTISTVQRGKGSGAARVSVKGAPETIKNMLAEVPKDYDETYKYFTRRGSRVLALASKEMGSMSTDKVSFNVEF